MAAVNKTRTTRKKLALPHGLSSLAVKYSQTDKGSHLAMISHDIYSGLTFVHICPEKNTLTLKLRAREVKVSR